MKKIPKRTPLSGEYHELADEFMLPMRPRKLPEPEPYDEWDDDGGWETDDEDCI